MKQAAPRHLRRPPYADSPRGVCRWCGKKIRSKRRYAWCSQECVDEYTIRSSNAVARHLLYRRDKGVCARCKLDASALAGEIRAMPREVATALKAYWRLWHRKTLWDANHKTAVMDGGGCCGLDNYETLCVFCHRKVTAAQRARRAKHRARRRTRPSKPQ